MTATFPQLARRSLTVLQVGAALALLALVALLLAGTAPSVMGYESFVVYSGSMEPAIKTGDIAVVGPVKADQLKVGDVITYRTPSNPDVVVTHRLMELETNSAGHLMFQTKGDANDIQDQVQVDQGALLGRVVYTLPRLGYMVDFSKRSEGKLLFIALPGILLAGDYLRERLRRRDKRAAAAGQVVTAAATPDAARLQALLSGGRRALDAGYLELARKAADGALELDARNEDAWILKALATGDPASGISVLQMALVLKPGAQQVGAALQALQGPQSATEHAAA